MAAIDNVEITTADDRNASQTLDAADKDKATSEGSWHLATFYLSVASHEVIDKCRHRHRQRNAVRRKTTAHEILAAARHACVAAIENVEIATADDRNASQNSTPLKLRRRIQSLEAKLGETKTPSSSSCVDSSIKLVTEEASWRLPKNS